MSSVQRKICVLSAALALALSAGTVLLLLAGAPAKEKAKTSAHAKTTKNKRSSVRHRSPRRHRRPSHRQRMARLKLEPERVSEIQEALRHAGYYEGEPSGRWDEKTRAAMQRYQSDHGFSVTGLPEAKTLMKLGLGPHPLPPAVDPTLTRASAENPPGAEAASKATDDPPPPSRQRQR